MAVNILGPRSRAGLWAKPGRVPVRPRLDLRAEGKVRTGLGAERDGNAREEDEDANRDDT